SLTASVLPSGENAALNPHARQGIEWRSRQDSPSRVQILITWGSGDDLAAVHARLDDLEGDLALHGLGLLGHEDGAHAALADLLEQLVRPDHRAGALAERVINGGDRTGRLQEAPETVVFPEQRPDAL